MTFDRLETALKSVSSSVYHYKAHKENESKYIVWAEDGQSRSGYGDNRLTTQVLTGTVDYFTKAENDPNFANIQQALNGLDLAWKLNSIQYEDDTNYIHYEWVWEVVFAVG